MDYLAYTGLLIFTVGILWRSWRARLWLLSGLMLVPYAHWTGDSIFIWAQTLLAIASFMLWWKLANIAPVVIFATLITSPSMAQSLMQGDIFLTTLGTIAVLGLIFGVVFSRSPRGTVFFLAGGVLMALYARIVESAPFFWLNVIFTISVVVDFVRSSLSRKPA